ncbi:MAG: WG repeat-containing protein [Bacteroidales bacterium]|nr:WG repeat-containing protein [Bacteroidales bacterium]
MSKNEQKVKSSTTFGRGIKQAARWVAKMFGYKAENKFARAVWYVFATSAAALTLYFAVALTIVIIDGVGDIIIDYRYHRMDHSLTYLHDFSNEYVSPYVVYHSSCPTYLYNTTTGRRTATDIRWICKSSDGDSLACFSTVEERKRGYFNRFTGEVVIPAQYQKAWIFSEGAACVYEKGILHFIDHKGQPVINKEFPYTPCIDDYCFHNGLCLMSGDNGKMGLIGRDGEWRVKPDYSHIHYESKGFWLIHDTEGRQGLLRANGEPFLPCEYEKVTVRNTDYISVCLQNHTGMLLDMEGNVVNSCDYTNIEKMEYITDDYDEFGELKKATAHCLKYRSADRYYGLMDRNGNIITPPLYDDITAIAVNLYHCEGEEGSVLLDDKGRECGEKL